MLKIRPYTDEDLDDVVALWYRSWTNAFPNLKHLEPFEEWKVRFHNALAKRGNVWVAQTQVQSVVASRPRKELNTSIGCLLPPKARTVSRKRLPVAVIACQSSILGI